MVGTGSKRDSGQSRKSKTSTGARARKPAVPPIIDLEATIVEDAEPETPGADAEQSEAAASDAGPAAAEQSATADDKGDPSWPDETPDWWMKEMKTFFLGGVHIGRWRVPAAGSLLVLAIFAGGLVAGRFSGPDAQIEPAIGPLQDKIAGLETTVRGATRANEAVAKRLETLETKLDKASEHASTARAAADAALSEVRSMDASLQDLARARGNDDATGETGEAGAAVRQQLSELAARIEQLAQQAPVGDGAALSQAVEQRIDAMAETLAGLKTAIDQSAARASDLSGSLTDDAQSLIQATQEQLQTDLAAIEGRLNERLKALENSFTGTVPVASGTAPAAVGRLQRAVDVGKPYQRELTGVASVLPGDPAFAVLAPYAQAGVPTRDAVVADFAAVAASLRSGPSDAAAPEAGGSGDLVTDVLAKVSKLVRVRKTSEPGSRNVAATVDAATARLGGGDLAGAADLLAALGDGLPEDAAKWVEDARARAQVDAAMAGLLRRAIMAAPEAEDS